MNECTHPAPEPFGTMDVSWSEDGLTGTVVVPCVECGEYVAWEVS